MSGLRASIVGILRAAPAPLRIAEIAAAAQLPHSDELRSEVALLVRAGKLARHHHPDGLRYSATGKEPAPRAARAPALPDLYALRSVDDRATYVLAMIRERGGNVKLRNLRRLLDQTLTRGQIGYLLRRLELRGEIDVYGSTSAARVRVRERIPMQLPTDGTGDPVLLALTTAAAAAQEALAAYRANQEKGSTA